LKNNSPENRKSPLRVHSWYCKSESHEGDNGAVIRFDGAPSEALCTAFTNTMSLPKAAMFYSSGRHPQNGSGLFTEVTG
jgi:hypothetical protein